MATKPTDLFTWAKLANYTIGPFVGSPTKNLDPNGSDEGFVPGQSIIAEDLNYPLNITGSWITSWLDKGTFNNDLDAHLVETDSDGISSIAGLRLGGTSLLDYSLTVTENTGDPNLVCVGITHAGDAPCLTASTAGDASTAIFSGSPTSSPCFYIEVTGSGAGQKILTTGSNALEAQTTSGRAVKADVTTGTAVEGTASANGFAGFFTSNGSLDTIRTTNNSTGNALRVQNLSTGRGISVSTTSGNSIEATSTTGYAAQLTSNNSLAVARFIQNGDGYGLVSNTVGSDAAVLATNTGTGFGLNAISAENYAIVATGDPTVPDKGTLRLSPQIGPPASPDAGGLFFDSTSDTLGVGYENGGSPTNRFLWGTDYGFCSAHNRSAIGVDLFPPPNAVTDILTCTVNVPNTPNIGDGWLEVSFNLQARVALVLGGTNPFRIKLYDVTDALTYTYFEFSLYEVFASFYFGFSGVCRVPAGGPGARQWALQFDSTMEPTQLFSVTSVSMSIHGVFEADTTP